MLSEEKKLSYIAKLEEGAEHIRDIRNKYCNALDILYDEADQLKNSGMWKEIPSDTFRRRLKDYKDDFALLVSLMRWYEEYWHKGAMYLKYKEDEENIQKSAQSL